MTRAGAPSGGGGSGSSGSSGGTGSQLTWVTTWLPGWVTGQSVSQTLTVTGGFAPYTWSVASGNLPDGVSLNTVSGVLRGKVWWPGQGQVVIQATDAKGATVQQVLRWDILNSYEREIVLNGQGTNVPGLVRTEGKIPTTYMPIWYVMQALNQLHLHSVWTGTTWVITGNSHNRLALRYEKLMQTATAVLRGASRFSTVLLL